MSPPDYLMTDVHPYNHRIPGQRIGIKKSAHSLFSLFSSFIQLTASWQRVQKGYSPYFRFQAPVSYVYIRTRHLNLSVVNSLSMPIFI